jgi:glycosyltransferase involved in cell wall biosynthesis
MVKLSIVTPTFNSSITILRTIESVYNQNYKNFEHIIIDGKSKDNTLDLIKEFSNYQITCYSEKDDGIYDAMNKGIIKSSGEIIAIINSDDFYADNNVLSDVIDLFDKGADIVYGGIAYVNKFGQRTFEWIPSEFNYGCYSAGWHTPHPAFFVRKHLYESKGFFDLNFKVAADFDLMLRLMEDKNINSVRLPRVLVFMQDDGASSKFVNIIRGMSDISKSFNKNNIRFNPMKYFLARYLSKLIRKLI